MNELYNEKDYTFLLSKLWYWALILFTLPYNIEHDRTVVVLGQKNYNIIYKLNKIINFTTNYK